MAQFFKPSAKKAGNRQQQPAQNKAIELSVSSVDSHGQGVARLNNNVVFVDTGLPGEKVRATIYQQKNRFAKAHLTQVLQASEQRITPKCEYFGACGGCQTQHCEPLPMLAFKQQAIEQSILRSKVEVVGKTKAKPRAIGDYQSHLPWQAPIHTQAWQYRRKTRLSVDARNRQKPLLGYRKAQSKQIVGIEHCDILTPGLQPLLAPLQGLFSRLALPDAIGHISLFEGNTLVQVCFRLIKHLSAADISLLVEFARQNQCQVLTEDNKGNFSALTGLQTNAQYSPVQGITLELQPNDFVQVNDKVNQAMIRQAIAWLAVDATDTVLDLYCGIGNFSLALAKQAKRVIGVEGVTKMVQQAQQNALSNGIDNCLFIQADLSQPAALTGHALPAMNKILLDPAREGAAQAVIEVASVHPDKILYVSCNPNSFARDAALLYARGYKIDKIALMDMFAQTAHTELMALFVPC